MMRDFSIGAIVVYDDLFLLLKYKSESGSKHGHWGFVKGHKEKGESDEETILRELEEETGIVDASIIPGFEDGIQYYFKLHDELIQKKVKFYLIEAHEKEVQISYEHEDYIWLPYQKALKKVTFNNARRLLKKAKLFMRSTLKSYV